MEVLHYYQELKLKHQQKTGKSNDFLESISRIVAAGSMHGF
jgi:hypothetical protein